MSTDEIDELRARIAELEQRLRFVTAERDEARRAASVESALPAEDACPDCEGEGDFWVHDFHVDCKRCAGTGRMAGA